MSISGGREKGSHLAGLFAILMVLFGNVSLSYSAGAGYCGVEFLNIGVGSRAVGMGGAFSAIADDPSASYWNPAGLTNTEGSEALLQHIEHFQDIKYEYAAYSMKIGQNQAVGVSIAFMHMGSILQYDANDSPMGDLNAYDVAYGLSYAREFSNNLSLGLGAKKISQNLGEINASGWAFDAGLLLKLQDVRASLVAANWGTPIKYELESANLPTEYRLGMGYISADFPFILSAEYGYCRDGTIRTAFGAEYHLLSDFSFRGGYGLKGDTGEKGGFSMGCGLRIWSQQIDYAFLPDTGWGDSHRISAIFSFARGR